MPIGNGGIFGKVNAPTASAAKGVWSIREAVLASLAGNWPVTSPPDPYFEYTTLLLPGNGTTGAQNNTFLDSSSNNFSVTRNGNTTQGTFSPFSQTGWGNYFDGTGDYLTTNATQAIPATGDFTIEAWIYPTVSGPGRNIVAQGTSGASGRLQLNVHTDNTLQFAITSTLVYSTGTVTPNQWNYVAVTRTGSSVAFYINGSAAGTATLSGTVQNTTLSIGSEWSGDPYRWLGYISNVRISNVVRTITAAPTAPFTSDANTVVLTCQANRFIDASSNAYTITRNGDVSVQAFSPFNPGSQWSAGTNGGSGYFDGSGDYLSVAASANQDFGSSAFTVEFWWYSVPNSGRQWFYAASTDYWFGIDVQDGAGGLGIWASSNGSSWDLINSDPGGNGRSGVQPQRQAWNHIVVGRSSGTWSVWLNGTRVLNLTGITGAIVSRSAQAKVVGGWAGGSQYLVNGYLSNFRVVIGTDVYGVSNSTITVPTAPVTAITNTQLLLSTTNAGIYDATSKNDLETVGNAQISTTQSKWGGSSIYLDGTGDYLAAVDVPMLDLGTANFTIEAWVYITGSGSFQTLIAKGVGYNNQASYRINVDGGVWKYYLSSDGATWSIANNVSMGNSAGLNTWQHIALVRNGNTFTPYVNGVAGTTTTSSSALFNSNKPFTVGADDGGTLFLQGYVQDLRVTYGYARYTSNFTAPTAAFPLL